MADSDEAYGAGRFETCSQSGKSQEQPNVVESTCRSCGLCHDGSFPFLKEERRVPPVELVGQPSIRIARAYQLTSIPPSSLPLYGCSNSSRLEADRG